MESGMIDSGMIGSTIAMESGMIGMIGITIAMESGTIGSTIVMKGGAEDRGDRSRMETGDRSASNIDRSASNIETGDRSASNLDRSASNMDSGDKSASIMGSGTKRGTNDMQGKVNLRMNKDVMEIQMQKT